MLFLGPYFDVGYNIFRLPNYSEFSYKNFGHEAYDLKLGLFFGSFLGVCDITKGVKISKILISDFIIDFPSPKRLLMRIFRSIQTFYQVFWDFRWFSGHFGWFWGFVTSQKGQDFRFLNFEFLTAFPFPKRLPMHISRSKKLFYPLAG